MTSEYYEGREEELSGRPPRDVRELRGDLRRRVTCPGAGAALTAPTVHTPNVQKEPPP